MNKTKKRGQPQKASIKKILKAIEDTGGLKTAIAAKLNVHLNTVLNYVNKYETVRQAIQEEQDKMLDKAESNLFVKIEEGDEDTSKWFLARKGKQRGYSEKIDTEQKIEHKGEVGIKIIKVKPEVAKKIGDELAKQDTG